MKAILIRVAILLFVRWLKKTRNPNDLIGDILGTSSIQGLINVFESKRAEDEINKIVTDIEDETLGNVVSDIIRK